MHIYIYTYLCVYVPLLAACRQINYSHAPRGPMVNFRYYLGRLYMQQEQFDQVRGMRVSVAFTLIKFQHRQL